MLLVGIIAILIVIGLIAHIWGAWRLAQYGFRISTGTGIAVLLFPPFAFYFGFFKLQQDGKEMAIAGWLFGLLTATLLTAAFIQPLTLAATGRADELDPKPEVVKEFVPLEKKDTPSAPAAPVAPPVVPTDAAPTDAAPTDAAPTGGAAPGTPATDKAANPAAVTPPPAEAPKAAPADGTKLKMDAPAN